MKTLKWLLPILATVFTLYAATSTDKQLKNNEKALKQMQQNIKKAEQKVKELGIKENSVLKTISEIDNGLTQTREHLSSLQKQENTLKLTIENIEHDVETLQKNIDVQKQAIKARIRNLYIHGKKEEWELLLNLIKENENPERKLYWVQRLLDSDKRVIESYTSSINRQREKKIQLEVKQTEMATLHERKATEELKLKNQLLFQNDVLTKVKNDKTTQERAINEYKKNQQTLNTLITTLEKKRRAEIAAAKKKEEEQKKAKAKAKSKAQTQAQAKTKVAVSKNAPVAVGPKCTPLNGLVISDYGYHVNKDLNIKVMHLGTEIRGNKGEAVRAAATGTVVMVANLPGHGPSVILDHNGTYYSVYGHLASIKVKEGEKVKNCEVIGSVGNAESTNGYKLFFQIYKGTATVNPMVWLKQK